MSVRISVQVFGAVETARPLPIWACMPPPPLSCSMPLGLDPAPDFAMFEGPVALIKNNRPACYCYTGNRLCLDHCIRPRHGRHLAALRRPRLPLHSRYTTVFGPPFHSDAPTKGRSHRHFAAFRELWLWAPRPSRLAGQHPAASPMVATASGRRCRPSVCPPVCSESTHSVPSRLRQTRGGPSSIETFRPCLVSLSTAPADLDALGAAAESKFGDFAAACVTPWPIPGDHSK